MTPADRRIAELIDKWLTSIDLHLKYVELSAAAYASVQQWPKHDRPTRWVLEVARQKILELKGHCETRQAMGDSKFAESLELMGFLANLVGIQHIQRFIPLADQKQEDAATTSAQTVEMPTATHVAPPRSRTTGDETTREMPRMASPQPAVKQAAPQPVAAVAARNVPAPSPVRMPASATTPVPSAKSAPAELQDKIIADAVRLLKWGKPWHELAELIGRIADRPSVPAIRKFLRTHRKRIEAEAGKAS